MTDKDITIGRLLCETASLNYQLLQLQIDQLESELIPCISPLQTILDPNQGNSQIFASLNLNAINDKLTRLQHLKFELNQTGLLCRVAA